jgi:hypothetical protein
MNLEQELILANGLNKLYAKGIFEPIVISIYESEKCSINFISSNNYLLQKNSIELLYPTAASKLIESNEKYFCEFREVMLSHEFIESYKIFKDPFTNIAHEKTNDFLKSQTHHEERKFNIKNWQWKEIKPYFEKCEKELNVGLYELAIYIFPRLSIEK